VDSYAVSAGSVVWRAKRESFFVVGALGYALPFADVVNLCVQTNLSQRDLILLIDLLARFFTKHPAGIDSIGNFIKAA
jgi:hypothetical protein